MRKLHLLAALPIVLGASAPVAHAEVTRCSSADTELAFAGNDFVELSGDTGWFPQGFVAQLRLTAQVSSHSIVSTGYRATGCWDKTMSASLEGVPGSGFLDVAYGAELKLFGRIHTTVLGYDINWEGQIPIPWIPEDMLIAGQGSFDPRLDTFGVYVQDTTDPVHVFSTNQIAQFISVGGIAGGLYISVQGGMKSTYRAKKVSLAGTQVDAIEDMVSIARPGGGFKSNIPMTVAVDGTIKYEPNLRFAAGFDVRILGVRVVDWQLVSVPMNLPAFERAVQLTGEPAHVPLPELDGIGDGARMDFASSATQFLHIKNTGMGQLQLIPFNTPAGVTVEQMGLDGKAEGDLRVTVADGAIEAGATTLQLMTNDPDRPLVTIELGREVGGTDPGMPVEPLDEAGGCSSSGGGQGLGLLAFALLGLLTRRRR